MHLNINVAKKQELIYEILNNKKYKQKVNQYLRQKKFSGELTPAILAVQRIMRYPMLLAQCRKMCQQLRLEDAESLLTVAWDCVKDLVQTYDVEKDLEQVNVYIRKSRHYKKIDKILYQKKEKLFKNMAFDLESKDFAKKKSDITLGMDMTEKWRELINIYVEHELIRWKELSESKNPNQEQICGIQKQLQGLLENGWVSKPENEKKIQDLTSSVNSLHKHIAEG